MTSGCFCLHKVRSYKIFLYANILPLYFKSYGLFSTVTASTHSHGLSEPANNFHVFKSTLAASTSIFFGIFFKYSDASTRLHELSFAKYLSTPNSLVSVRYLSTHLPKYLSTHKWKYLSTHFRKYLSNQIVEVPVK